MSSVSSSEITLPLSRLQLFYEKISKNYKEAFKSIQERDSYKKTILNFKTTISSDDETALLKKIEDCMKIKILAFNNMMLNALLTDVELIARNPNANTLKNRGFLEAAINKCGKSKDQFSIPNISTFEKINKIFQSLCPKKETNDTPSPSIQEQVMTQTKENNPSIEMIVLFTINALLSRQNYIKILTESFLQIQQAKVCKYFNVEKVDFLTLWGKAEILFDRLPKKDVQSFLTNILSKNEEMLQNNSIRTPVIKKDDNDLMRMDDPVDILKKRIRIFLFVETALSLQKSKSKETSLILFRSVFLEKEEFDLFASLTSKKS